MQSWPHPWMFPPWLAHRGAGKLAPENTPAAFRLMDGALIERLHAKRLRALVYTVNDADIAKRLIDDGIDSIITEAVDRLGPR